MSDPNATLEAIKASLAAAMPLRRVQRSLPPDPLALPADDLRAGVVCLVSEGGGDFANYLGREGELGHLQASLVGFVAVEEDTEPVAIEQAELALLRDLLAWCNTHAPMADVQDVLPQDFTQSKQLEHPYGWLILKLDIRF
ncbi:hypothetical protein [Aquabacterium sp.]|uniref:hypothetical protein n=1 Tax=Aquabacterium sp. TaxID=1872578 RepID=UPI0025BA2076|nr:hypothetical protein [Aquabacterium sp.]